MTDRCMNMGCFSVSSSLVDEKNSQPMGAFFFFLSLQVEFFFLSYLITEKENEFFLIFYLSLITHGMRATNTSEKKKKKENS